MRPDHPLRPIRRMTDAALERMSGRFDRLYSTKGRPSIAPEKAPGLVAAIALQLGPAVPATLPTWGEGTLVFRHGIHRVVRWSPNCSSS